MTDERRPCKVRQPDYDPTVPPQQGKLCIPGYQGGEHIKKGPGGGRSFIPSPSLMTKRTITVGILGGDRGYMVLLSAAPAFSL